MALIDQNKDITRVVFESAALNRVELVDNRCNHICRSFVNQINQMLTRGRSCRGEPCVSKGLGDLLIKLFSVCNNNNARVKAAHFHKDILRHHNHSQRLTTALCMPNNTALTVSCAIILLNCPDDFFNGKKLLITADLFDICIVKNKILGQSQQTGGIKQRHNVSVLFSDFATNYVLVKQFVLPF